MIGSQAMGQAPAAPMQGAAPPADPQAMPPEQGQPSDTEVPQAGQEGEPATPEEQASYEQAMGLAMDVIYPKDSGKVSEGVLNHLSGQFNDGEEALFAQADPPLGQTPNDALSATAVMIVLMIDAAAEQAGHEIPDASLMQAGQEILGDLAEVTEAMTKKEIDQDALDAAWYRAIDLWRTASPRAARQQDSLKAGFEQVVAADKDGTLGQLIPGLGGAKGGEGSPPQQAQAPSEGP